MSEPALDPQRPFDLVLHLTHRCNMSCTYCYAGRPRGCDMSLDTAYRALEVASELGRGNPELNVLSFGGEPLLHFGLVRSVIKMSPAVRALRGRNVRFGLTTNGTLLTEERAAWLARHGVTVAVSIDGTPAAHDMQRVYANGAATHEDVLRGIRASRSAGLEVQAAMTVTPASAASLVESLDYLRELGVSDVQVTPDYDQSWDESHRDELQRQLLAAAEFYADHFDELSISFLDEKVCARIDPNGAWPCGFGKAKLAVSAAGHLYGCERMIHDDQDPTWRVGDVWHGLDRDKLRSQAERANACGARCEGCQVERACQHNCACVNLARTGDIGCADDFVCSYERGCLEAAATFWSRLRERRGSARPDSGPAVATGPVGCLAC